MGRLSISISPHNKLGYAHRASSCRLHESTADVEYGQDDLQQRESTLGAQRVLTMQVSSTNALAGTVRTASQSAA